MKKLNPGMLYTIDFIDNFYNQFLLIFFFFF